MEKNTLVAFLVVLVILLILGIIAHRAFCVDTTLNVAIFGRTKTA